MGHLITIEKWAENLEEVTLNRWLKGEGEAVVEGDSLCEIITDKITFEYEIELPGIIRRTYCPDKSILPVGYAIAFIGEESEAIPVGVEEENRDLLRRHEARSSLELEGVPAADKPQGRQRPKLERRIRATPAARRLARQNSVAIEQVAEWLKANGAITEAGVESYLEEMEEDVE